MTARLTLAILFTTWAVLVFSGAATYVAIRQTLLADLDETIVLRALALPQLAFGAGDADGSPAAPTGDRYLVRNDVGQTLARPREEARPVGPPDVIARGFAPLPGGRRVRSLTLRLPSPRGGGPVTVVYSTPADAFDRTLQRLAVTLAAVGAAAGLITAAAARRVSQAALRPLRATAEVIGTIDEHQLARRIDASGLPPELTPVASRLNEMLARLERVFTQRKQFLADAAHELRTPVAALLTTLEVAVRRPRENDELTGAIRDGIAEARFLRRLVEALLERVRGDLDAARVAPEPTDLSALFRECAAVAKGLGQEKGVTVSADVPPDLTAVTQPTPLRSIVTNLMSNAVDATDGGGNVALAVEPAPDGLQITVRDTGKGIAAQHLPHVFEPFYRGDASRRNNSDHLGLGLFLVRSHVEALGGTIDVQSQAGQGTTFRVRLPCSIEIYVEKAAKTVSASRSTHGLQSTISIKEQPGGGCS